MLFYPKRLADGTTESLPIGQEKNLWFYLDEMIQLTETNCISQKQTLRNIWLRRSSLK
jgi:hypothetical protein